LISSFISSMTHQSLSHVMFYLHLLEYFLLLLLLLDSRFIILWSDSMKGVSYYICWDLLCVLRYVIFWRKFHGLMRRMCVVLFCTCVEYFADTCQVQLIYGCLLVLEFLCWCFCLDKISIFDRGALKSHTTTVLGSICDFKSFHVCSMKLGTLILSACKLIIVISSWCIALFISMKCPFLNLCWVI
jgi:hypothetical protein